jgi:hypothetical protein
LSYILSREVYEVISTSGFVSLLTPIGEKVLIGREKGDNFIVSSGVILCSENKEKIRPFILDAPHLTRTVNDSFGIRNLVEDASAGIVPTPDARGNLFQSKISEIHSITLLCLFNLMVELAIPTLKLVVEVVHVSTLLFW